MLEKLLSWVITLNVLGSGFTLDFFNKAGFIPALMIPLALLAVLKLAKTPVVSKRQVYALFSLLVLLLVNGSSLFSILLVMMNLYVTSLAVSGRLSLTPVTEYENRITLVLAVIAAVAMVGYVNQTHINQITMLPNLLSRDTSFLGIYRLQLFAIEPSYLGSSLVMLASVFSNPRNKIVLYVLAILTFSYFTLVLFAIILLRKYEKTLSFIVIIVYAFISLSMAIDPDVAFTNSGLVRLVGVTLYSHVTPEIFIVGAGLGAGNDVLADSVFLDRGVDVSNGFFYSTIYDIGIIGLFLLMMLLVERWLHLVVILIMLTNFGLGSAYLPFAFLVLRLLSINSAQHRIESPATRLSGIKNQSISVRNKVC